MRCSKCQNENPAANKFCSACGAPLTLRCPKCNHENGHGTRYCGACGQFLAEPTGGAPARPAAGAPTPPAAGERRQATVMLADLSGYTAMTERLDPEEVDQVIGLVKQAAARTIERHGGTVNQFVGDEVVALFGIPQAEEDDPVRAVRAALALHAEIREKTEDLAQRTGGRLAIHTGINTGLIIAQQGDAREGRYRLTGDAINTAARLRSLAEADQILIGPATERLVRPYFALEARAPTSVKGKAAPLVPYRVMAESRISSRFEAARERGFQRHIGRFGELEVLQSCFARAVSGEGLLVTIEGEPGIGKSRLLHEFLSGLDREQVTAPQGRCQSHAGEIPYFPFLDGLRRGLHLSEHDSHADALQKAIANIKRIDPSLEKFLPHLLHLLSIPSDYSLPPELTGEALRRALEDALVAVTTLTAKTTPMVFAMEDWHWSDPASQSALRHLLRLVPSYRLMVVVSYRSGYSFDFGPTGHRTAIHLHPLDEAATEELIMTVTGAESLPARLSALVCQSADGNPLFVEEACFSLLESGAASVSDRRLVLHQPLDQLLLPDTVQAVIRARLDRLDPDAKKLVGLASVIGREFNRRILERIWSARAPLEDSLETLQTQEIIRQTNILPEPVYSFRHVLTREVAYDTLLLQQRKQLHEAVALAIEELYPERLDENAPILAHHYARSPQAAKAVHYALLAGDRAARFYANVEAAKYYDDALALATALPKSPDVLRWRIDAILGQIAVATAPRDMERDRGYLDQAHALAEELGDRRRLARALYWLGRHHYVIAKLERAIEYARRSLEIADELDDATLAAPPVNLMGRAYWQLSDFRKSAEMMERSVEQMKSLGNATEESTAAGFVGALLGYMGEFEKALSYSDRSIKLAQALKNPYAEAASFHYRGITRDQQGQWEAAIADYATAQKMAEKAGDMFRVYLAKSMEGRAYQMAGDLPRGRKLIEDGISLAKQIGTTFLLGQAKTYLAACCLAEGGVEEAKSLCAEAIGLAEKAGDKFTEALALRALADGLGKSGAPGDRDRAKRSVQDAIGIQEGIGAKPELARSYVSLACILKAEGEAEEAANLVERAKRTFAELGMSWDLSWAVQALDAAAISGE
jgi:predicted ATPase/class 3 adenylate cyclase